MLLGAEFATGAVYLAGYGVECALKALILSLTPASRIEAILATFRGNKAHDYNQLKSWYRRKGERRRPKRSIEPSRSSRIGRPDFGILPAPGIWKTRWGSCERRRRLCDGLMGGSEMSVEIRGKSDKTLEAIAAALEDYARAREEARITIYRYGPYSIRVRIIDPHFDGMKRVERNDLVWDHLSRLSEDDQADINQLVLITPGEVEKSLGNLEFENPIATDWAEV